MDSDSQLFKNNADLADRIAAGYTNIAGVTGDDLQSIARVALHRASGKYDPSKGPFEPYAKRAIRNALNDLHAKQARHAEHEVVVESQPGETTQSPFIERTPDPQQDVAMIVACVESREVLEELLAALPTRDRTVLGFVAQGLSYSEMGERLAISKQAAHKAASSALDRLRDQLAERGFKGLNSQGLLKSASLKGISGPLG